MMLALSLLLAVSCLSLSQARLGPELESLKGLAIQEIQREVLHELKGGQSLESNPCHCSGQECSCCHDINIKKLKGKACFNAIYLPVQVGFSFTFTWNGKVEIKETISVENPPPFCINAPYLKKIAKLCIKLRNVHLTTHSVKGCVYLEAKIPLVVSEDIKIGCFSLPPAKAAIAHERADNATLRKPYVPIHQNAQDAKGTEKTAHKEDIERLINSLGLMEKPVSTFVENAPKIKSAPLSTSLDESRQTRMINSLGLLEKTAGDFLQHTKRQSQGQSQGQVKKAEKSTLTNGKAIEMIKSLGLLQRTADDFLQHVNSEGSQQPTEKEGKLTKSEQIKMIKSLGLIGKKYNKDGRLANTVIMN